METILRLLKSLSASQEDVDLFSSHPGYDEFNEASEMEYTYRKFLKAKVLYEKACDKEHPMALCNYALWYLEGNRPGVGKNLKKAFELFQRAADKKVGMALYNLADFYRTGKGGIVKKDERKVYQLLKESLNDPLVDQMREATPYFGLGKMYMYGEGGCNKNIKKALQYFEKARDYGHPGVTPDFLKMVRLLAQVSPWEAQRESDMRWDRMCAYLDEHPEEKGDDGVQAMRDHLRILNKFGFQVDRKFTRTELDTVGGFDKFMELAGGRLSQMEDYEMKDEPTVRKCGCCGKAGAQKRCGQCGEAYCNRACQKQDWKDHKPICKVVQDALN